MYSIYEFVTKDTRMGHLPCKPSRVTKFIRERRCAIVANLIDTHYRCPLVQGRLDINSLTLTGCDTNPSSGQKYSY